MYRSVDIIYTVYKTSNLLKHVHRLNMTFNVIKNKVELKLKSIISLEISLYFRYEKETLA